MKLILLITVIGLLATSTPSQEPCPVDNPCDGIPRWSEHGNVRWRDERARLDNLASQFRKSPNHVIYSLVYAGMRSCKDEARLRALRAKKYLVQHHSISPKSISWRDGGFLPELSFQIWLLRHDQPLPEPSTSMTIDPAAVKSQRSCMEYRRGKW
jgi:hypothetical protein